MGDKYIQDGKLYEKGSGFFGGDKELGTVEEGGIFSQDTVKMHDIFTPDMKIERTGLLGENVDLVSKDTLSELIEGKREGTRLETENHILYDTSSSYEWTQELGGAKIPRDSVSSDSGYGGGSNSDNFNSANIQNCANYSAPKSTTICKHSSGSKGGTHQYHKEDHRSAVSKHDHRKDHRG